MNAATPPSLQTPTRVRFVVLTFLCSLSLLTYLDRICISRVQENIQEDLLISDDQIGLVFSAFTLGYLLFEVPGGWMGDRWGSRRVLTRIVLWWSLFTALTGSVFYFSWNVGVDLGDHHLVIPVLSSFLTLLLVRFLFGCGEAGAYPNVARVVGNWFPYRERAVVLGAVWTSGRLGGALAPLVIGGLTRAFGWRRAFWVLGVIGIAWCVLFAWWFRDRPEDKPECNDAERDQIRAGPYSFTAQEAGHAHGPVPWRALLLSPNLWAICLASFCVCFAWWFFPSWYPRFLKEVHHFSYEEDPLLKEFLEGLPFLCGAVGCLVGGRLSDRLVLIAGRRWGRSWLGLFGFGGGALCFLAGGLVRDRLVAVALLSLACFLNDMAIPVIWALTADVGGRYAGTVSGFMNMVGGVAATITPSLIRPLYNSLSGSAPERWAIVIAVLASVWFVGALAWLGIDASKPLFPKESEQNGERPA